MFQILKSDDLRKRALGPVEFEGKQYGAGVSFFVGNLPPGQGPGMHKHPYPEIFIVISGRAAAVVDGKEVVASAGEILVIGPETSHRFTALDEGAHGVAIHASDHFVIEWITEKSN